MATRASDAQQLLERWRAEHPDLVPGDRSSRPAPRPRTPAPAPPPVPIRQPRDEQLDMIERWQREHAERIGQPRPRQAQAPVRDEVSDRRVLDLSATPLTVLGAFIIGCIIGGIVMTIVTGIAFWGFSGG